LSPRLAPTNPFLAAHEVNSFPQPPTINQQTLPNMASQSQLRRAPSDKEDTAQLFVSSEHYLAGHCSALFWWQHSRIATA
jgi:hypothetical protein